MENSPNPSCIGGGRGRRSLSSLESDCSDLRRPFKNPIPIANSMGRDQTSDNVLPRIESTLSADAPEFVPRFFSNSSQPVAQPEIPNNISSFQQATTPDNNYFTSPPFGEQGVPMMSASQLKYVSHPIFLQVNEMVVNLTLKPHKFDQIAMQMTSILSWKVKDVDLMKEIISVIFEQGVGEPNFRFNGGRLYQHLSKHVVQSYNGNTFRNLLFQKCQTEYACRDFYLQNEPSRLCGFTLFLADIFTHLLSTSNQPFDKLREGLRDLLLTLLTKPSSTNLKCVAQVLKGTGNLLDAGGREEMDSVMCVLKDVAMLPQIPLDIRSLLLSLVELRAANWGRSVEPPPPTTHESSSSSSAPAIGTVYYGPGGESRFVEDDLDDSASDTDDSYYGIPMQGDELDGEAAKAFEEFLKEQQQHQQFQHHHHP